MTKISYSGYRFPPEIIQQAIWLYVRFTLSFRDVEDLLAERGLDVSHERSGDGYSSSGRCSPRNFAADVIGQPRDGISTRWRSRIGG